MKIKTKIFLAFLSTLLISISVLFSIFYADVTKILTDNALREERIEVDLIAVNLSNFLKGLEQEVLFLSEISNLEDLINSREQESSKSELTQHFLVFSKERKIYYQIRYIDENGQEIIRIDSGGDGHFVIPEEDLQNKKHRYYFEDTMKLKRREVFISPLDLNIERGRIENRGTEELPIYVPVIRYATPVFDDNDNPKGIVITNVYADYFLNDLKGDYSEDSKIILFNKNGYYLFHPDEEKTWGFMFESGDVFYKDYQGINSEKFSEERSQFFDNQSDSYVIYNLVYPDVDKRDPNERSFWVLANVVSKDFIFTAIKANTVRYFVILSLVILFIILVVYFLSKTICEPILKLAKMADKISVGKLDVKSGKLTRRDEIGRLSMSFDSMARSLREREKEKHEFITSASHQLRTPSSGIKSQIELLRDKLARESESGQFVDILDALKEIGKNNDRTILIINDLFRVLELGGRYLASNIETVAVEDLVVEIMDSFNRKIVVNKLDVDIDIPSGLKMKAEKSRIKQVLINLIENAINYSNDGGKIKISAKDGKGFTFTISDDGIGIPSGEKVNIFDKFFRAKNVYLKQSVGTGLGLAIVETIVKGHGGKVGFKSTENSGSTFWFSLPI